MNNLVIEVLANNRSNARTTKKIELNSQTAPQNIKLLYDSILTAIQNKSGFYNIRYTLYINGCKWIYKIPDQEYKEVKKDIFIMLFILYNNYSVSYKDVV